MMVQLDEYVNAKDFPSDPLEISERSWDQVWYEIYEWLDHNIGDCLRVEASTPMKKNPTLRFASDVDAMAFKLRWL